MAPKTTGIPPTHNLSLCHARRTITFVRFWQILPLEAPRQSDSNVPDLVGRSALRT